MFCKHCGKENTPNSSFCGSCGHSLDNNLGNKTSKKTPEFVNKFKELPKKKKIIMLTVLLIVIVAFIVLVILLNNPVKKVEDNLANYYDFYSENRTKELAEIGKIIKNNKDNSKVLNSIKETTQNITSRWVKNFNMSYKNVDSLENAYEKISSAINNLYNYYRGLDYILDYDLYVSYMDELDSLYSSKKAFFQGEENKQKGNDYYAYYYYQKVIANDFYYNLARSYVTEYVQDELNVFKENVNNIIKANNVTSNEEKLEVYFEALRYIKDNKVANNIDLSSTDDYQRLYEEVIDKITETTKLIVDTLSEDYDKCLDIINKALDNLGDSELKEYGELLTLRENYEEKIPESLLDRDVVSKTPNSNASLFTRVINDIEYDNYISFKLSDSGGSRAYNLNKEYKTFKTNIIKDDEIDNINGIIVIYGDDKELYRLEEIKDIENVEIDVSNVNILKIEFLTNESLDNDLNIYLVEPYLYK